MNNSEAVYREILQKSLNRITDEIILLETQNSKLLNIVTNSDKRLEQLRLEQEQIRQELKGRIDTKQSKVDGIATEFIDDRIKAISEKQEDYSKRITELESLKREVNSNIARAIINKRINHEKTKIRRLRGAKNLISDVQKAMMMPKHIVDRYRLGKYSKRQGDVNYYNNKVSLVEAKKNALNPEQSIIDKAKSAYYDRKGKHYAKKLSRANKLLEKLQKQGTKTHILGANAATMNKKNTDKLRNRLTEEKKKEQVKQQPLNINDTQKEPKITPQQQEEKAAEESRLNLQTLRESIKKTKELEQEALGENAEKNDKLDQWLQEENKGSEKQENEPTPRQLPAVINTAPIPENITAASLAQEAVSAKSNTNANAQQASSAVTKAA